MHAWQFIPEDQIHNGHNKKEISRAFGLNYNICAFYCLGDPGVFYWRILGFVSA
jgi:hypothetical protein